MSAASSVRRQAYSPSTRMTLVADSGPLTTPVSVRCTDVFYCMAGGSIRVPRGSLVEGPAKADFDMEGIKGRFLLSLNDRPEVRALFGKFKIEVVSTRYSANPRSTRRVNELLIGNAC